MELIRDIDLKNQGEIGKNQLDAERRCTPYMEGDSGRDGVSKHVTMKQLNSDRSMLLDETFSIQKVRCRKSCA